MKSVCKLTVGLRAEVLVWVSSPGRWTEKEKRKQIAEVGGRVRQKEIKEIKGDEKAKRVEQIQEKGRDGNDHRALCHIFVITLKSYHASLAHYVPSLLLHMVFFCVFLLLSHFQLATSLCLCSI